VGDGDDDADKYISKVLPTNVGRVLFPSTAALIGATEHLQTLAKNTRRVLKEAGKHLKRTLGFFLVGGLPTNIAADILDTTSPRVRHFQKKPEKSSMKSLGQNYTPTASSSGFTKAEESVLEDFFFRTTSIMSGAVTTTRNLEKTEHEWDEELYALWPQMLRNATRINPQLAEEKQPLTKKEKELGDPHGVTVLCVAVHEIMGPSSVYITWSNHLQITLFTLQV
jgi:hypothetical protein